MGKVTEKKYKVEDILFLSKKRISAQEHNDVFISIPSKKAKTKKGGVSFYISFHDSISEVFKNDKYLLIGAIDNRIYFKPIETSAGFKIQQRKYTKCVVCQLNPDELKTYESFAGKTYHLEHDDNLDLYYVEKDEES